MNKTTRKIRAKGYSLDEFLDLLGRSLRWYRQHSGKGTKQDVQINDFIDSLENK